MASDDILLQSAAELGVTLIRFYGWSEATVSLGYFQESKVREFYPHLAALPWVRRPSGGKTLLHDRELTYAIALPPRFASGWMTRMHQRIILPALNRLGLNGKIHVVTINSPAAEGILCFKERTIGDLECAGHKITGSAQRKHRGALLQHGAVLLSQHRAGLDLPGIRDLTGIDLSCEELQESILDELRRETGWQIQESTWTDAERGAITELTAHKYQSHEWNEKR